MKKAVIGIDGLQEVNLTDSEIAEENKKTKRHNDALPELEKQKKLELRCRCTINISTKPCCICSSRPFKITKYS